MKYYLKLLAMPLFLAVLFASMFIGWKVLNLPTPEELAAIAQGLFDAYGFSFLFVSSFVEGALLIGGYFPGVFVIFLGVILAASWYDVAYVIAVVTAGLTLAHACNYVLGRYGWYRLLVRFGLKMAVENARVRLIRHGPLAIFSSYWLPSFAALTDTAAGILRIPFPKFLSYSLRAGIVWNSAVAVFIYTFKETAFGIASPGGTGVGFIFGMLFAWAVFLLFKDWRSRRMSRTSEGILSEEGPTQPVP